MKFTFPDLDTIKALKNGAIEATLEKHKKETISKLGNLGRQHQLNFLNAVEKISEVATDNSNQPFNNEAKAKLLLAAILLVEQKTRDEYEYRAQANKGSVLYRKTHAAVRDANKVDVRFTNMQGETTYNDGKKNRDYKNGQRGTIKFDLTNELYSFLIKAFCDKVQVQFSDEEITQRVRKNYPDDASQAAVAETRQEAKFQLIAEYNANIRLVMEHILPADVLEELDAAVIQRERAVKAEMTKAMAPEMTEKLVAGGLFAHPQMLDRRDVSRPDLHNELETTNAIKGPLRAKNWIEPTVKGHKLSDAEFKQEQAKHPNVGTSFQAVMASLQETVGMDSSVSETDLDSGIYNKSLQDLGITKEHLKAQRESVAKGEKHYLVEQRDFTPKAPPVQRTDFTIGIFNKSLQDLGITKERLETARQEVAEQGQESGYYITPQLAK